MRTLLASKASTIGQTDCQKSMSMKIDKRDCHIIERKEFSVHSTPPTHHFAVSTSFIVSIEGRQLNLMSATPIRSRLRLFSKEILHQPTSILAPFAGTKAPAASLVFLHHVNESNHDDNMQSPTHLASIQLATRCKS